MGFDITIPHRVFNGSRMVADFQSPPVRQALFKMADSCLVRVAPKGYVKGRRYPRVAPQRLPDGKFAIEQHTLRAMGRYGETFMSIAVPGTPLGASICKTDHLFYLIDWEAETMKYFVGQAAITPRVVENNGQRSTTDYRNFIISHLTDTLPEGAQPVTVEDIWPGSIFRPLTRREAWRKRV